MNLKKILSTTIKKRGYFLLGLAFCVTINLMPTPEGLTLQGKYVLGLLFMVIIFFLTEAIPFVAISFLIVVYQVLLGIRTYQEVPKTFMHDAVFFIMGALMIACALVKYNVHKRLAALIMNRVGGSIHRIVFAIVAIAALNSAFMSEHAVATMLLPIGVGLVTMNGGKKKCPQLAKLIMFSIAYGAMIGAIATPSGGTRNIIMISYLQRFAHVDIGYGRWMLYVFPLTLLLIPVVSFILPKVFRAEIINLNTPKNDHSWIKVQKQAFSTQEKTALGIFVLTILSWIFWGRTLGLGQIAILSAALYLILGLVRWDDYARNVNWQVVLLYAGIISLGECIKDTGLALWIAQRFFYFVGNIFAIRTGIPLIASTSLFTMILANSMGAGPTVAVIGPIALKIGELGGVNPVAIGVSAAVATSFAYIMIAGAPASMIVYGSGFLHVRDFIKAGWVFSLISIFVLVGVAGVYWRFVLGIY